MIALLAALLVGAGVFTVLLGVRARDERRLRDLRAVLETSYLEERPLQGEQGAELRSVLARGGAAAEAALGGTGAFARIRVTLERSDWTITAGEFAALSAGASVLGLVLGLLASSPVLAGLLAVTGLVGPWLLVQRAVARRRKRFEEQFPDVLDLLAASLAAGSGITQALELVVAEADEPSATEFARVLSATRLGTSLVDALEDMAERLDSRDLRYTVRAIGVQQRTGGRLAEVLRIVADFMRGRAEVRRELDALTAEGRLSAYVLGALPFALAGFIALANPDYLTPLFTTLPGLVMVAVAGTAMAVAFVVMSRIVKIEV